MTTQLRDIEKSLDPGSGRCGRLLNWQNDGDPFWHYGIGLSDTHVFDTGRGLRVFSRRDCKAVIGIADIQYPPMTTIGRLGHAIEVFKDWRYNLLGWNCEHLGRLIATNRPRCYQSKRVWFVAGLDSNGDHKTARQVLEAHLRRYAIELL